MLIFIKTKSCRPRNSMWSKCKLHVGDSIILLEIQLTCTKPLFIYFREQSVANPDSLWNICPWIFRFDVTLGEWIVNYDHPESNDDSFYCEKEPGVLWIMGGYVMTYLDTTYLVSEPEGLREGPGLPLGMRYSCAVAINRTHSFIAGKKKCKIWHV